jgi:hypothetical protein
MRFCWCNSQLASAGDRRALRLLRELRGEPAPGPVLEQQPEALAVAAALPQAVERAPVVE